MEEEKCLGGTRRRDDTYMRWRRGGETRSRSRVRVFRLAEWNVLRGYTSTKDTIHRTLGRLEGKWWQ
jgi:hypothetical protein